MLHFSPLEQGVYIIHPLSVMENMHFQAGVLGAVTLDDVLPRFHIAVVKQLIGYLHGILRRRCQSFCAR